MRIRRAFVVSAALATLVSLCSAGGASAKPDVRHVRNDPADGMWTAEQAAYPSNWSGTVNSGVLQSVSCATADSCVAVGNYVDSSNTGYGLIDTLQGGAWVPSVAPLPTGGSGSSLSQVTCPAAGSCVALGSYGDANIDGEGLIETLSDGIWTPTAAPVPAGVPSSSFSVTLSAVSCPAAGSCVVDGEYNIFSTTPDQVQLFVDTLSDGSWTATDVPLPSNAGPSYYASDSLQAVSCPSAGWCGASGQYIDTTGQQDGLLEILSDGTWTATEAPAPGSTASDEEVNVDLSDLACPVVGSCEASGGYNDLTQPPGGSALVGPGEGILETLSGGAWSDVSPLPLPADADTTPSSGLNAIACPAAGSCVAVGNYTVAGNLNGGSGFVESLSGETWTPTALPLPANDDTGVAVLTGLSCPAEGSCLAVGRYQADDDTTQVLTAALSGGSWTVTEGPLPSDADTSQQNAEITMVNCSTPETCAAVGRYSVVITSGFNEGRPGPQSFVDPGVPHGSLHL
jgi:hypothetical protein